MAHTVLPLNLGVPRIGEKRELKKATESFWKGEISESELLAVGEELRERHWKMQREAGIPYPPVNDFSYYDQMLDMICLLGAVPERYGFKGGNVGLDTYFAMARGSDRAPAMEMTKWFDTNYHYIVPELTEGMEFRLSSSKVFDEFAQAGRESVPVLIGPLTFLILGKKKGDFCRCTLVEKLVPVYAEILSRLQKAGAGWVQIDEPCLTLDLEERYVEFYGKAYAAIAKAVPGLNILLATYFEGLRGNLDLAFSLPVASVHVDLVRAPDQLDACIAKAGATGKGLSLGLVDGRNIWRNDLSKSLAMLEKAAAALDEGKVAVAPSCSLIHTPVDLDGERDLDPQVKSWMAFAKQKLSEVVTLAKGASEGRAAVSGALKDSDAAQADRASSRRTHNPDVRARTAKVDAAMLSRKSPFASRRKAQQEALRLPLYPTTSIGSFPQTQEIRKARAAFKKGEISGDAYEQAMKNEIETVVRYQEKIGMDVLVHGEPERNDMVEYFGEQLEGFTFTRNGWVQSYGSRCVKPPVVFGDVSRPAPMTVAWSRFAQSLTRKPMKGMLTGPITILQWSFVRDDQPRSETCRQIALAIRDEVCNLEAAGIRVIQIDEPAIREGLPLRRADWAAYLKWAVDCFRLSASGVRDETQIHTHMCYSEFNDIIDSIGAMDADVISIETSRSQMELLDAFVTYKYPNEIGPGVYDIHSPRVPSKAEMLALLEKARKVLAPWQIWVNPDCGLKTRGWKEVEPALQHMVEAALEMRARDKSAAA